VEPSLEDRRSVEVGTAEARNSGILELNDSHKRNADGLLNQHVWGLGFHQTNTWPNRPSQSSSLIASSANCNDSSSSLLQTDIGHLFFKCKKIRASWQALNLEDKRQLLVQCKSGTETIDSILQMEQSVCQKMGLVVSEK
jgi:hypothetical protein